MVLRTAVSGLQVLFPFLVILLIARGRVNGQVTCQTSGGSPKVGDANDVVAHLASLGNTQCCQSNCASADACTNLGGVNTAASSICGNCGQCIACQQAGISLDSIIKNCASNGLVGGYIFGFANPTVNVNFFHS